jgi:signal transduction histidine kinase/CheY-like chemotaxis protein
MPSWLEPEELDGLRDFWRVYDDAYDALQREALPLLATHPVFGPLMKAMPDAQREAQSADSRLRLRRAIEDGAWEAYEDNLRSQGATYGRMGVRFQDWYDVLRVVGRSIVPRLIAAYVGEPARLEAALGAKEAFFDHAMATIGESYIASKEDAVRRSELTLSATLASLQDGVTITDLDGHVVFQNLAARGLRLDLADVLRTALDGRAVRDVEVTAEGRALSVHATPIRDFEGRFLGAVAIWRDVSQRRRALEIESESRRIQEASRLKSEFLANMSHELRTPLNAIIGFTELIHDGLVGPTTPKQTEFLGDILASGRHLLQLINDVLDLSKVEAGKMVFHPETVAVERVFKEVAAILRTVAANKKIRLETEVAADVGEVVLDPARLKQVLYNYLSNALKFTPEGGRVIARAVRDGSDHFRLEVRDTGCGIAAADLPRLFVEFQQLEEGADKRHGGTGLGLALTRRLVEAQGGTVAVDSSQGRGSCFSARLPMRAAGATVAPPLTVAEIVGGTRILVVEDDPNDRRAIVDTLVKAGYVVEAAATGAMAIEMASHRSYAAITLDLILPDLGGLDVLKAIRHSTTNGDAPVFVITIVAEGVPAGFPITEVLDKPFDGDALLEALRRAGVHGDVGAPILVLDDDLGSLKLMASTLERLDFRVSCYSDGEAALRSIAQGPPRMIVLDLMMPGMSGFEFLERLHETPAHRAIPTVVWTVKDLSADELARLRSATRAILAKGLGPSQLVDALLAALPEKAHG